MLLQFWSKRPSPPPPPPLEYSILHMNCYPQPHPHLQLRHLGAHRHHAVQQLPVAGRTAARSGVHLCGGGQCKGTEGGEPQSTRAGDISLRQGLTGLGVRSTNPECAPDSQTVPPKGPGSHRLAHALVRLSCHDARNTEGVKRHKAAHACGRPPHLPRVRLHAKGKTPAHAHPHDERVVASYGMPHLVFPVKQYARNHRIRHTACLRTSHSQGPDPLH